MISGMAIAGTLVNVNIVRPEWRLAHDMILFQMFVRENLVLIRGETRSAETA